MNKTASPWRAATAALALMTLAGCHSAPSQKSEAALPLDDVQARYTQAHKLIEQDAELPKAKALLDEVLASQPEHARARFDRGMIALREGRSADALEDLRQAASIAPQDPRILGAQCVAMVASGLTSQGLAVCDAVLAQEDHPVAVSNAFVARGQARLMLAQNKEALADFDAALQRHPTHMRALYGKGLAQERLGESEAGQRNMDQALKALPGAAREFVGLAARQPKS